MEESVIKSGRVLVNAALVTEELLVKAQEQQVKTNRRLTEILVLLGVKTKTTRLSVSSDALPPLAMSRASFSTVTL